jgi:IS30 family transposase
VLKKELIGHLRSKRRIRRSRHSRIFKESRGQIVDAISIRERPAKIEDRAVPGHWEGDLIGGTKNSHIATLVERHSRFYRPGQGAKQRHGCGRRRNEPANSEASNIPTAIVGRRSLGECGF